MKQGAKSIPTELLGADKSDLKLQNIFLKIFKAHLIYRMSFFYFPLLNMEKKLSGKNTLR
jgi:hypothetical protein